MSAFKVGDEVLVRGTFLGPSDSEVTRIAVSGGIRPDNRWWIPTEALEPATRAPWVTLREAAEILPTHYPTARVTLRDHADTLEAAARPPSLRDALVEALGVLIEQAPQEQAIIQRGQLALAAAEREAGQ